MLVTGEPKPVDIYASNKKKDPGFNPAGKSFRQRIQDLLITSG